MNEYPLYPELSEEGKNEAQLLVDEFKKKLTDAANDVISKLYCDTLLYIESDSWSNFRNEIIEGFQDYNNRKIQNQYDFKKIRTEIFKQFKTDIIKDLDKDIYEENIQLKQNIEHLTKLLHNR